MKNSYIASPLARNDLGGRGGDDDDQHAILVLRAADHDGWPPALEFQGRINECFANQFSLDDLRLNYPCLDSVQPGVKPRCASKAGDRHVRPRERLLGHIECVLVMSNDLVGHVVRPILVPAHQDFECRAIATLGP